MAFLRKKKINGKEYIYIVKNKWTERGSRQKARYIGKAINFSIVNEIEFDHYCDINFNKSKEKFIRENSKIDIINEIIKFELYKRGFKEKKLEIKTAKDSAENKDNSKATTSEKVLCNDEYYYKGRRLCKIKTNKEAVLEMNEGFLCRFSTDRLLRAKITGYDEREKGIKLAKALLEAGLKVENEVFVLLFEKWNKE